MAARPATRRPAGRPMDVAPRAIVRDLTRGAASFRIDWDVRTAFDFIFSLSGDAGATDDLPATDRTWLAETRASLPEPIQAGIKALFESELAIHAGVLLVDQPDVRTSADVVALVERLTPADLMGALFAEEGRDPEIDRLLEQALAGDASVIDELDERLPEYQKKGRLSLLRDPAAAHDQIVAVLRAWQVPFSAIEDRVLAIL